MSEQGIRLICRIDCSPLKVGAHCPAWPKQNDARQTHDDVFWQKALVMSSSGASLNLCFIDVAINQDDNVVKCEAADAIPEEDVVTIVAPVAPLVKGRLESLKAVVEGDVVDDDVEVGQQLVGIGSRQSWLLSSRSTGCFRHHGLLCRKEDEGDPCQWKELECDIGQDPLLLTYWDKDGRKECRDGCCTA